MFQTFWWLTIGLVPLYIALTGASPSVIRAGMMAMIALYAAYRNRLKDGLHVALIAGIGMLIWNPYYVLDVSFQLSYLVTMGIMLGVPHANKLLPIRSRKLREAVSITVVAQLISFPLTIYYFNQFSLLSMAANLVLVPVFSVFVMPVGTVAMLLSLAWPFAGTWLAWTAAKVNSFLFIIVEFISRWHIFQTIWPSPKPQAAEQRVIEQGNPSPTLVFPSIDVLKVAHHGSKSSTSEAWLNAWRPKHAVISAGVGNVYGHPNAQVIDRLNAHNVRIHRTDRQGEIQMQVKKGSIFMRTKLSQ
ncbi:ComEC/Rec2 family competence protein [Paenibacillus cremeus]|uniref:ComEC/Rec2-related protein domain-containing protein n=1 Tax=Paenibacillus cremeus TaxID=2163881 RepID=A0A559KAE0_9BACL|nr:ComEC/Rec2 family competence protein [Paenibacillus cremeus]TVY09101.1 hypothetical protein FPZ49_15435 [Paenibacillus cremeus]